jgi:hypothetical protein
MQLFKWKLVKFRIQKHLQCLQVAKPLLNLRQNDKITGVNKFNILNVKVLLENFIRTFTSRKFAFMDTTLILCVEESGLGEHD